jgi:hypothetical protein
MQALDDVIYAIIDVRRKEGVSKDDLLSILLDAKEEETGEGMDNKQLRDEVMTIFIAGNETSSNALSWMFYLLSQNPEAEQKMMAEINEKLDAGTELTFENLMQFNYVRMVIEESMRLYPPAWSVGRRNIEDDEIGGYHIVFVSSISEILGRADGVSSGALCPVQAQQHRPICVYAVWRRTEALHRQPFRYARNADYPHFALSSL